MSQKTGLVMVGIFLAGFLAAFSLMTYRQVGPEPGVENPIGGSGSMPAPVFPGGIDDSGTGSVSDEPIGERDEHGCLVSAGYSWCVTTKRCIRSWEETCETQKADKDCHLQTCHGLEVLCGAGEMRPCTMMYAVGDKCLKYAQCETVSGSCRPKQNTLFEKCKSCVEKCLAQYPDDTMKTMECEASC